MLPCIVIALSFRKCIKLLLFIFNKNMFIFRVPGKVLIRFDIIVILCGITSLSVLHTAVPCTFSFRKKYFFNPQHSYVDSI